MSEVESLQSLCLNYIVSNFDVFCSKFYAEENENFQFYLDFIQRCCCDKILQKLSEKNLIWNNHLPIIINKYTKELNFRLLLRCDFNSVLDRLKEYGHVIEKFFMTNIDPFYSYDDVWRYLSKVHSIDLQETNCSDKSVFLISNHCPQIRSLNLKYCVKVSDKSLIYLSQKKPPLESLNVKGTVVTYKGVASVLKNIDCIQSLWFDNVPRAIFEALGLNDNVVDISKHKAFKLTNMVVLNNAMRPENHLTSMLEICRSLCPFIKDLTVTEIVTEKHLSLCTLFEKLKNVHLQHSLSMGYMLSINDFLKIRGENLETLTMINFSFSLEVLMNCCPKLEVLTLQYSSFENAAFDMINVQLPHLKSFSLNNGVFNSEESIKSITAILSSSPNLEELNLRLCECLSNIYEIILSYPEKLKILSFSNTRVHASFLEKVLNVHDNLVELRIDNSGITTAEYDDLMDIVDNMERKVHVAWADYKAAISELYATDVHITLRNGQRHVLKF